MDHKVITSAVLALVLAAGSATQAHAQRTDPGGPGGPQTVSRPQTQAQALTRAQVRAQRQAQRLKQRAKAQDQAQVSACDTTYDAPALWYYLDNDGTPLDVAYSDYLEDLAWHNEQFNCDYQPETLE